jgi:hypothetical protein
MNIRPVGAELLYADEQTDMTKLIDAFCSFVNSPKRGRVYCRNISFKFKEILSYYVIIC